MIERTRESEELSRKGDERDLARRRLNESRCGSRTLSVSLLHDERAIEAMKKMYWQGVLRSTAQADSSTAVKPIVRLKTQPLKSASASLGLSYGT